MRSLVCLCCIPLALALFACGDANRGPAPSAGSASRSVAGTPAPVRTTAVAVGPRCPERYEYVKGRPEGPLPHLDVLGHTLPDGGHEYVAIAAPGYIVTQLSVWPDDPQKVIRGSHAGRVLRLRYHYPHARLTRLVACAAPVRS